MMGESTRDATKPRGACGKGQHKELSALSWAGISLQHAPHASGQGLRQVAACVSNPGQGVDVMSHDVPLGVHVKRHKMLACKATKPCHLECLCTRLRPYHTRAAPIFSCDGGYAGQLRHSMSHMEASRKSRKNHMKIEY